MVTEATNIVKNTIKENKCDFKEKSSKTAKPALFG